MLAASLLLLLAVASADPVLPGLYTHLAGAAPCSALYSLGQGTVGCAPPRNAAPGRVRIISSWADLGGLESSAPAALAISSAVWNNASTTPCALLSKLASLHVASQVLVLNDDAANPVSGITASCSANLSLLFPMAVLNAQDTATLLNLPADRVLDFQFYMGPGGALDSASCISQQHCLPLGGLSVWGGFGLQGNYAPSEDAVLVTANMDSAASLFHDLSADFATKADVIVLLSAMHAIGAQNVSLLQRNIIAAIFQGEAWNLIGSRRFVKDISSGVCRTFTSNANVSCADPPSFSLQWTKLSLGNFNTILSLNRIFNLDWAPSVYVTPQVIAGRNQSQVIGQEVAQAFSGGIFSSAAQAPLSSLTSFAENPTWSASSATTGGAVLSGYSPASIPDASNSLPAGSWTRIIGRIVSLASNLSQAIVRQASGPVPAFVPIVDAGFVENLTYCLVENLNCPMLLDLLNVTSVSYPVYTASASFNQTSGSISTYTGVYKPNSVQTNSVKTLELFLRNTLSQITSMLPPDSTVSCASDVDCRDNWSNNPCSLPSSIACVSGTCLCSNAFFHDAWSAALSIDVTNGGYVIAENASMIDSFLWAEPFWTGALIVLYEETSSVGAAVAIVLGLLFIAISYAAIRMAGEEALGVKDKAV